MKNISYVAFVVTIIFVSSLSIAAQAKTETKIAALEARIATTKQVTPLAELVSQQAYLAARCTQTICVKSALRNVIESDLYQKADTNQKIEAMIDFMEMKSIMAMQMAPKKVDCQPNPKGGSYYNPPSESQGVQSTPASGGKTPTRIVY